MNMNHLITLLLLLIGLTSFAQGNTNGETIKVSNNKHYFSYSSGEPFFWLGDTGWLLFSKLDREEAEAYLENRRQKGFNVVQVMVLHQVNVVNAYGDAALIYENVATPLTTIGNNPNDSLQYDYWDHVDYIVDLAASKGIYMAMVPVWGAAVKSGKVDKEQAATYGKWLAKRYKNRKNIVWLNGGDQMGSTKPDVWLAMGKALKANDPNHLISFHPYGRTTSSMWFNQENWLDFNLCQSGHRTYEQGYDKGQCPYGEDNWRYIEADYAQKPIRPCLDGEPSYENIPHGLHDTTLPRWKASDLRRYAYWSVFAGAAGFTYGENSVMQFFEKGNEPAYGAQTEWTEALEAEGAQQMHFLKQLMLDFPYFERMPDQSLVAGENGQRYQRISATRGNSYALFYTYTGQTIPVNMGRIKGAKVAAAWYNPKDGTTHPIGTFDNKGIVEFDPQGEPEPGNDWVLILKSLR
jgi:hypothetical protein